MGVTVFKAKSLTSELTDGEIRNGYFSTRFISFESCIRLMKQEHSQMGIEDKPDGYRVTNQGIEVIYEK